MKVSGYIFVLCLFHKYIVYIVNKCSFFCSVNSSFIYTIQQKKQYKGLMLNIVYIERKNRQKQYNLDSYGITNKAMAIKFVNIIIRSNHGQTEMLMQYGSLRSSVTCVTISDSNDSFASPTHKTNQSLDKRVWDGVPVVHK